MQIHRKAPLMLGVRMKQFVISIMLLMLIAFLPAKSMSLQSPDDGIHLLKSQEGFLLVYNQDKLHFTIEFIGRELARTNSERIFFKIDGRIVQLQTANLTEFLQVSEKPNLKDTEILEKHRDWEQKYLGDLLKAKLDVKSQKVTTNRNREGLLWHFPMPDGVNQQLIGQVFVTSVVGDQVLVLNVSVEQKDTVLKAAKYLIDALNSLKVSDKTIDLKTVQEEIRKG